MGMPLFVCVLLSHPLAAWVLLTDNIDPKLIDFKKKTYSLKSPQDRDCYLPPLLKICR